MKNAQDGLISKLNIAKEIISELEDQQAKKKSKGKEIRLKVMEQNNE